MSPWRKGRDTGRDGAKADAAPTREDSLAAAAAAFAIDVPPPTLDAAEVEAGLRRAALERSAERKVLLHLLPTLFLFSLLNYIDRSNLAFASVELERDLGINNAVFGLASGVFFVTYCLGQIPCQLLAVRLGSRTTLALLAAGWGVVASSLAAVNSEGGLLAQRVFLGALEAGALPAMWYANSVWFPTFRLTVPSTCVMMAITVAQAISGPLAAGLLALEGRIGSLKGWQILFLFEGLPAVLLGGAIWLFMPNSIADAGFLTPEEKEVWAAAVASTDSGGSPPPADPRHSGGGGGRGGSGAGSGDGKAAAPAQGSWAALRSALTCPVVFCAGTWRGFYATALYGVMYFTPLILREIVAKDAVQVSAPIASLLASIPFVLGAISHACNALHSTATGERRRHIATPWLFAGAVMAFVPVCMICGQPRAAFALFTLGSVGLNSADGVDVSWVTSLLSGEQRALGLAAVNMLTNIGGFVGPYVIGALSTATGNFNASLWFVAGAIFTAGTLVAAFPLKWAAHTDTAVVKQRAASALELRRASEVLSSLAGSRRASSIVSAGDEAFSGGGGSGGGGAAGAPDAPAGGKGQLPSISERRR